MQHSYKSRYCLDHVVSPCLRSTVNSHFPAWFWQQVWPPPFFPNGAQRPFMSQNCMFCVHEWPFFWFHVYLLMHVLVGEGKEKKTIVPEYSVRSIRRRLISFLAFEFLDENFFMTRNIILSLGTDSSAHDIIPEDLHRYLLA
jgi:hypothetical protein